MLCKHDKFMADQLISNVFHAKSSSEENLKSGGIFVSFKILFTEKVNGIFLMA